MSQREPDELAGQLRAWKVEPQVPPGFQREVWQRIAARPDAAREDWFGPSRWLAEWIARRFAAPRPAFALVAAMLLGGIGLAHVQAQGSNARNWKRLEARYADSVNPLAMMAAR